MWGLKKVFGLNFCGHHFILKNKGYFKVYETFKNFDFLYKKKNPKKTKG